MKYDLENEEHDREAHWNGQIILISNDNAVREHVLHIIGGAGGRIVNPMPIDFRFSDIEKRVNAIAVILHISDWNETVQDSLSSAESYCLQYDLPMIILLPFGLLDHAIASVHYPNIEFLMTDEGDSFPAELLVTLNNKIVEPKSATFSNRDEPNLADLRKISADVDRIARVLAQLSKQQLSGWDRAHINNPVREPQTPSSVSDDPFDFKEQEGASKVPYGDTTDKHQSVERITANHIRKLIKARRLRDQYFETELFADPAWDMLLDLMAARLEKTTVSVSSLCIAASVPPTTALRWIKTMTEEKIFERIADETDGRRIFIQLSDASAEAMASYFSKTGRNNLMIV